MRYSYPFANPRKKVLGKATLCYDRTMRTGPPCLVFIPGWGGRRQHWAGQIDGFRGQYPLLVCDLPGFGDSRIRDGDLSVDGMAGTLLALLDEEHVGQAVPVGHSLGAAVGLRMGVRAPERIVRVVGADAYTFTNFYPRLPSESVAAILAPLRQDFITAAEATAKSYFLEHSDPGLVEAVARDLAASDSTTAIAALKSFLEWDLLSDLDLYPGRVDALVAEHSYDATAFEALCGTRISVTTLSQTGHYVMLEQAKAFNAQLKRILATKD